MVRGVGRRAGRPGRCRFPPRSAVETRCCDPPVNPWSVYLSHPQNPGKNAKTRPQAPLRGPGPHCRHLVSGRVWSVIPEDRARKMIPVSVCAGCGPEGACGPTIIRHRCDKVNTLVGDPAGFFCHSVFGINRRRVPTAPGRTPPHPDHRLPLRPTQATRPPSLNTPTRTQF